MPATATSASRPVAVTNSTGTPGLASAAMASTPATKGRTDPGPVMRWVIEPVASRMAAKNGSLAADARSPRSAPSFTSAAPFGRSVR